MGRRLTFPGLICISLHRNSLAASFIWPLRTQRNNLLKDKRKSPGLPPGSVQKQAEIDLNQSTFPTLSSDSHDAQLQWHVHCDDVDKVMSGLVSPAPESFSVLHSAVSKIGSRVAHVLNDTRALADFLVKPNYVIELYNDAEIIKWRLVPRVDCKLVTIYPSDYIISESKSELYHEHSVLKLSQMALDIATKAPNDYQNCHMIEKIARQAEQRLKLTLGSDLRGPASSDTCFNFALAGVQHFSILFRTLVCIGTHELKRTGHRASFPVKNILHMVEKFAASDMHGEHALDLYHIAGVCLEKKGYSDASLIESLKNGSFGFHCNRPLLWLWRYSSRQKKVSLAHFSPAQKKSENNVDWDKIFYDTRKPLVIDVGSGTGSSLLNLSSLKANVHDSSNMYDDTLQIPWCDVNYAGADLNKALVNFASGIISRDAQRSGRAHFFHQSAEDFLTEVQSYPGNLALIMINFPSPYRLEDAGTGNSQLPSKYSNQFMVTKKVLTLVAELLLKKSSRSNEGLFLFQTKCEDVILHVKRECLSLGTLDCSTCKNPVKNIDLEYNKLGKRPRRVDEWLNAALSAERAEGKVYSITPFLPLSGRPETEVQCGYDNAFVHRCLFRRKPMI
ncbi:hypothetical protein ACHAWF_011665 [Thalassiosira exigua]